jgi:hypothetical protein
MGELRPAGGLAKKDIRNLLIRSTTWQSISITVLATIVSFGVKYALKHDRNTWHWIIPFVPVVGFLIKKLVVWTYQTSQIKGVGVGTRTYAYVGDLVRQVSRWHGLPEADVVGFGPRAEIVVTVTTPLDLTALKQGRYARKQKVIVRVGAPLLLTLSARQIAVLLSFHLAVLDEPFPARASALMRRQSEFASAKPGSGKAKRGVMFAERTRGFTADVNARGWARADRTAGSRQAAQEVFATAGVVMKDFAVVEEKYKALVYNDDPHPSAFYYGWAVSRRAARTMTPGEAPTVEVLEPIVDKAIVNAWDTAQVSPWRGFMPTWEGILSGGKKVKKENKVAPEQFDYSWLLADPYGLQSQAAQQQHSAWSQY